MVPAARGNSSPPGVGGGESNANRTESDQPLSAAAGPVYHSAERETLSTV